MLKLRQILIVSSISFFLSFWLLVVFLINLLTQNWISLSLTVSMFILNIICGPLNLTYGHLLTTEQKEKLQNYIKELQADDFFKVNSKLGEELYCLSSNEQLVFNDHNLIKQNTCYQIKPEKAEKLASLQSYINENIVNLQVNNKLRDLVQRFWRLYEKDKIVE